MRRVAVVGAGSWGTALARMLARKGESVALWAYEPDVVAEIQKTKKNQPFLPDFIFPDALTASNHMQVVVQGANVVVLVVPSHVLRRVAAQVNEYLDPDTLIVCCTKGIEIDSGQLMSEVLADTLSACDPARFVYLSGPSFAREVAAEHPTAVVVASRDAAAATQAQSLFRTPFFLPFLHHDVIGVEVGGALKNVMAIAAGIVEGMGLGHNTRAALITRGLYEMIKLGMVLGAEPLTFAGLAGMGDLILTCTGDLSRNRTVGMEIGKGHQLDEIVRNMRMVAEGVSTAKAVHRLITQHHINAPICTAVHEILFDSKSPQTAMQELTSMEITTELGEIFQRE